MNKYFSILCLAISFGVKAQKIDSIYFNLYTDSLKKGVYNYINVDGKLRNGTYMPLMDDEIFFKSNIGTWKGNSLLLNTSTKEEKVTITATLKSCPEVTRNTEIYLKKINTDAILKSEKEVIENWGKKKGRG